MYYNLYNPEQLSILKSRAGTDPPDGQIFLELFFVNYFSVHNNIVDLLMYKIMPFNEAQQLFILYSQVCTHSYVGHIFM